MPRLTIAPALVAAGLLLAVALGSLVVMRVHRRQMSYANQKTAQFFTTAIDRASRVWRRALHMPHLLRLTLHCVTMPTIHLPMIRLPKPFVFRGQQQSIASDGATAAPAPSPMARDDSGVDHIDRGPASEAHPVVAPETPAPASPDRLPQIVTQPTADTASTWTAEDRALVVVQVITEVWAGGGALRETSFHSPLRALDTARTSGDGPVVVTIDQSPAMEALLVTLPDQIVARRPLWHAAWRQEGLEIMIRTDGAAPPIGGPLLVPILAHGRGGKTVRFYLLGASMPNDPARHLGLYGADALGALHTVLASLLYAQPPAHLALAIIDQGEIAPLYRDLAHLVPLPGAPRETIERLAQAISRGARGPVRRLLLVVVEPDETLLTLLSGVAARLQARPTTPVHLIIVQEHLRSAGRELYALLPALITSVGRGSPTLLPGQSVWPRPGMAHLVGRGLHAEGRALTLDEVAIAAQLAPLRGRPADLPLVLWDTPVPEGVVPPVARVPDATPIDDAPVSIDDAAPQADAATGDSAAADSSVDDTAQRQRIAQAIVARRQLLLDADMPPTTPPIAAIGNGASTVNTPADADVHAAADPAGIVEPTAAPHDAAPVDMALGPSVDPRTGVVLDAHAAAPAPRSRRAALYLTALDAGRADALPRSLLSARWSDAATSTDPAESAAQMIATPVAPPPLVETENGWPIGPAPVGRVAMADLMARIVATPAIVAGQANELGVTKNRLVDLLTCTHKAQAKELAEILLAWFDLAGVLVEPTRPERLRHPRALVTTNLIAIAAKLNSTPCPDSGTVQALWSESNAGRE